jgi:hypothetical protein
MSRNRSTRIWVLSAGICLGFLGLGNAPMAVAKEEVPVAPHGEFQKAADLEPVKGMAGWRRYKGSVYEVNVPIDWLYSRDGELAAPKSVAGWARVALIPYLPYRESTMGNWEDWVREHVKKKNLKRLQVGTGDSHLDVFLDV